MCGAHGNKCKQSHSVRMRKDLGEWRRRDLELSDSGSEKKGKFLVIRRKLLGQINSGARPGVVRSRRRKRGVNP